MAKRSTDWNEGLARNLQDPVFARQFIIAAIEESISVQAVLAKIIHAFGVKEFAKKAHMSAPNIVRAIRPNHNPTQETLNRLLRPLGLKLAITVVPQKEKRRRTA